MSGDTKASVAIAGSDDPAQPGSTVQEAELADLRARLREVEAALGLPARLGQPVPPSVPALLRRVAALERRMGIVPGRVPLPGCGTTTTTGMATTPLEPPRSRRQVWRDRGQMLLAAALLVALLAWLLRPLPSGQPPARPATTAAPTPAMPVGVTTAPIAVAARPAAGSAPWPLCSWAGSDEIVHYEHCPPPSADARDWEQVERGQVAPGASVIIPGEPPCPLGGTAACGMRGPPAPVTAPPLPTLPCLIEEFGRHPC